MTRSAAEIVREYGPFPGVDGVHGVTYDGQHVWFAAGDKLHAFNPANGETLHSNRFFCRGERSGKVRAVRRPRRGAPAHMHLWREGSFPARFRRRRPRLRSENIPQCEAFDRQTASRKFNSASATGNQSRSLPASQSANCASASSTRSSRWDRWPHESRILPIAAE